MPKNQSIIKLNFVSISSSQINQDPFCWICCDNEPAEKMKCAKCIRSFHDFCLTPEELDSIEKNNGLCMICIELNAAENTNT